MLKYECLCTYMCISAYLSFSPNAITISVLFCSVLSLSLSVCVYTFLDCHFNDNIFIVFLLCCFCYYLRSYLLFCKRERTEWHHVQDVSLQIIHLLFCVLFCATNLIIFRGCRNVGWLCVAFARFAHFIALNNSNCLNILLRSLRNAAEKHRIRCLGGRVRVAVRCVQKGYFFLCSRFFFASLSLSLYFCIAEREHGPGN